MREPRFAIIGAGMAGVLSAIKLKEAGLADFTVYEKAARLGGTWRENRYPGLTCDVPSRFYLRLLVEDVPGVLAEIIAPEDRQRGWHGVHAPAQIPWAQESDLIGEFDFQRSVRRVVPSFHQAWDGLFKPGEIGIVSSGDQRTDGEVFRVLQDLDGVKSTRGFAAVLYVRGIVFSFRAARPGSGPRRIVGVIEPTTFRI